MGFPLIGETLHFFSPTSTYDIPPFIKTRMSNGQKVIVSTDHEFNYQIFQPEGKDFQSLYLDSFNKIVGENQSMLAYQGSFHKYLKNLILHLHSPQNLKEGLILEMGESTRTHIFSWVTHHGMVSEFIVKKLLSYEELKEGKKLKDSFNKFMDGLISFPLDIPGTAFHACIKGRQNVIKVIKDTINKRKASKKVEGDFLDHLLEEMKNRDEKFLNEAIVVDMVFMILFASFETTSSVITLAIKLVSDHPQVLAQLTWLRKAKPNVPPKTAPLKVIQVSLGLYINCLLGPSIELIIKMWDVVGLCMGTLIVIMISHWCYRWQNPKSQGKLPPGSMAFPLIGETLHFFSPTSTYDIPPFIKTRMSKYGSLFRTSIVGQKVIVSTDHEFNYQIFQQEGKDFRIWYLETFNKIVGDNQSMLVYQGTFHKYLKNLILHLLGPQSLKERLILEMGESTRTHILSWLTHHGGIVDVKQGALNMVFEFIVKKLLSYEELKEGKKLKDNFNKFMDGLISFPLNIPGTAFHACIKGRQNVIKVIKDTINTRKKASKKVEGDFLDHLLEEMENREEKFLNEAIVVDMVFSILFASFETTSSAITLAIKLVSDHPQVLVQLTVFM
ncbi:hypothetical protein F8388_006726 [Cannabis sativa]|uniref:Cytochrome P450 n=1 Tax=Cannabis sativa TaxID=3483 RepID=A0A7J6GVD4_CANSA|nr:hypothetical protein F8388_006726 [Cannabis sativa]